jgi:hypothetical protein
MTSVSSDPGGVADLLQTFSGTGASASSSALSLTKVQTALQSASPGDIVQLSDQAVQLQQVAGLFASSEQSGTASNSTIQFLG